MSASAFLRRYIMRAFDESRASSATSDEERGARQAHLQQAESGFDALPFDAAAARAFGQVAVSLRQSGRKTAARCTTR